MKKNKTATAIAMVLIFAIIASLAALPRSLLLQATHSRCSNGWMENRFFGHSVTQLPHAVHFASSITGSLFSFMCIASKRHARLQSPKPRQPHVQFLPPPATSIAARQESRPA